MEEKHTHFPHSLRPPASKRAFSRIDLLAVVLVVLVVGVRMGMTRSGESKRIAQCAANLSHLGKAMHGYANENNDALPAAGMDLPGIKGSWDTKLFPYLAPGLKPDSDELLDVVPNFLSVRPTAPSTPDCLAAIRWGETTCRRKNGHRDGTAQRASAFGGINAPCSRCSTRMRWTNRNRFRS